MTIVLFDEYAPPVSPAHCECKSSNVELPVTPAGGPNRMI